MCIALRARHFTAAHPETVVLASADILRRNRRPETRPAGAGIIFRGRAEQGVVAADTAVQAAVVKIVGITSIGPFCPLLPRHVELHGCELRAPLRLGLDELRRPYGLQFHARIAKQHNGYGALV